MNLFQDATILGGTNTFDLLPQGVYKMKLRSVKPVEQRTDFDDPSKKTKEYFWTFETMTELTTTGKPYTVIHFTSRNFIAGSANNQLNKLLTSMLGRQLSVEEFREFDEAELFDTLMNVVIGIKTKRDGATMNIIDNMVRVQSVRGNAAPATVSKDEITALW
jgi:hypothetical protein